MLDGNNELAQEYFVTASLLNIFRLEIDVLPRSFQQMRSKWDSTYPGVEADLTQRFDASAQLALLENWSRLIDHAGELHGKLAQRIEKRAAELLKLRDSVSTAVPPDAMTGGGTWQSTNNLAANACQTCLPQLSLSKPGLDGLCTPYSLPPLERYSSTGASKGLLLFEDHTWMSDHETVDGRENKPVNTIGAVPESAWP